MAMGPWQLIIIAVLVLVLFGRGKISNLMGDVGQGISAFKKGLSAEPAPLKAEQTSKLEGRKS